MRKCRAYIDIENDDFLRAANQWLAKNLYWDRQFYKNKMLKLNQDFEIYSGCCIVFLSLATKFRNNKFTRQFEIIKKEFLQCQRDTWRTYYKMLHYGFVPKRATESDVIWRQYEDFRTTMIYHDFFLKIYVGQLYPILYDGGNYSQFGGKIKVEAVFESARKNDYNQFVSDLNWLATKKFIDYFYHKKKPITNRNSIRYLA